MGVLLLKSAVRAVALLSGGLDSTLAAMILKEKGIEVSGLAVITPFFSKERVEDIGSKLRSYYEVLKIPVKLVYVMEEYFPLIERSKYGFGRHLNPCIDCKILFLTLAKKYMEEIGAQFVITGDVLGQRSMSQSLKSMLLIEQEAGLSGKVVRPLSGLLLPPTEPELRGYVERRWLLGIEGKKRTFQIKLAEEMGIAEYPQPAGGCLLTVSDFSRKVRDLLENHELDLQQIELLKIGRHFRVHGVKLVVGKNEHENKSLEEAWRGFGYLLLPVNVKGATGLVLSIEKIQKEDLEIHLKIVGRYCDSKSGILFRILAPDGESNEVLLVDAFKPFESDRYMV